ncbi:uncharacterized protein EMH_0062850 [Eimeria mitis]|uniref:Uncharacterized protein n=1 Tax=Eimeria mitis TaxID=44415 RepID=U6K664_9EIME|nr:uncharacterized protein EMH_0062850 [Eimeria mitis]CDJ30968.1 hypothetical protein EMH_0062850 [Eimeria mitis]
MVGESPLTATVLDILGSLASILTPFITKSLSTLCDRAHLAPLLTLPATKSFRRLCDMAQKHILQANGNQKVYEDARNKAIECNAGDKAWISSKTFFLHHAHVPISSHGSATSLNITKHIGHLKAELLSVSGTR